MRPLVQIPALLVLVLVATACIGPQPDRDTPRDFSLTRVNRDTGALLGCGIPDDWLGRVPPSRAAEVLRMAPLAPTPAAFAIPVPAFAVAARGGLLSEVEITGPSVGTLADILAAYGPPEYAAVFGETRGLDLAYPSRGRVFSVWLPVGDERYRVPVADWRVEADWVLYHVRCFVPDADARPGEGPLRSWNPEDVGPWPGPGGLLDPAFPAWN